MNFYRKLISLDSEEVIAFCIVIAFVLFSVPRLHLPFFWDATWVYVPAILEMSRGIPSLLADSLTVSLGRGHPLMFHFLGATWVKIFGFNPLSLNVFALVISLCTLVMTYVMGSRFFGKTAGVIALMICATQEMFLAQSLQILPEMLLTLFVLTTMYTFLTEKHLLYVLSGTALLLTKETGIVAIAAIGIIHVMKVFTVTAKAKRLITFWKDGLIILLPAVIASLHYIYQKFVFGWYLLPDHMREQIWDPLPILYRLRDVFDLIFIWQGRIAVTLAVLLALCVWVGKKKLWRGIVLLGLFLTMHQVFHENFGLPVWSRFAIPLACLLVIISFWLIPLCKQLPRSGLAVNTYVAYLIVMMAFTSINLLTSRYVLNALPVYALLCAWVLSIYLLRKWMLYVVLALVLGIFIYQLTLTRIIRDINLTYADGVKMHQEIVNYFSHDSVPSGIVMGTLLDREAISHPHNGYVDVPIDSIEVILQRDTMMLIEGKVDYLINTNILEYVNLPKSAPNCCTLVKEIITGQAHAEIYKIK